MENKLRELLDKTYELEGLIHLALKRVDSSDDFLRLISKKGKEVGDICHDLIKEEKEEQPEEENVLPQFSLEEYSLDEEQESIEEKSIEKVAAIEAGEKKTILPSQRGRLIFSINERFRFRKELFNNSDADFNNTLALVASMEDYEEAEDYFLNEEEFDRNNPVVKEFLWLIKNYFK